MPRRIRLLAGLAMIVLVSTLPATALAVHVLLEHGHEHGAADADPDAILHGHEHSGGTPGHDHRLRALPEASPSARVLSAATVVVEASTGGRPLPTCVDRSCAGREAVARARPPASRTPVLRI